MIQVYTYFENKDETCQCAFGYFGENFDYKQNPLFVLVENQLNTDGSFEILNTHEYEEYNPPTNENAYTLGDSIVYIESVGFWRIKYKS